MYSFFIVVNQAKWGEMGAMVLAQMEDASGYGLCWACLGVPAGAMSNYFTSFAIFLVIKCD